jgi:uncharacterized protein YciI
MPVFAVTTARGPNWDPSCGIREQRGWDEHASFFDGLVDRGVVILGGPIGGGGGDTDVGLLAVSAADERELRSVFSADPWAANGVLRIKEIRPWTLWLDSRPCGSGNG